ncbi:hypothetical protein ACLKA7_009067 [Drosophila subpalustris]
MEGKNGVVSLALNLPPCYWSWAWHWLWSTNEDKRVRILVVYTPLFAQCPCCPSWKKRTVSSVYGLFHVQSSIASTIPAISGYPFLCLVAAA